MKSRPRTTSGSTTPVYTGHGTLYVIVNDDEDGKPFEVFGVLGKSGGCDSAQIEAICRLISLLLRSGVGVEEVVRQLKGIVCCPNWDRGVLVQSVPDALAEVLGRVELPAIVVSEGTPLSDYAREQLGGSLGDVMIDEGMGARAMRPAGGRCPECTGPTTMEEGCRTCHGCGWSKCG